jgi:hypothetical protein
MRHKLLGQFNPRKTMKQLIADRTLYRLLILVELTIAWCM